MPKSVNKQTRLLGNCVPQDALLHSVTKSHIAGYKLTIIALFFGFPLCQSASAAEPGFEFNYAPHTTAEWAGSFATCGIQHIMDPFSVHCFGEGGSTTPGKDPNTRFLTHSWTGRWQGPEILTVNIDGQERYFYHMVLGELGDGFIQESYIEMGVGTPTADMQTWNHPTIGLPAHFGTNNLTSASGGDYNFDSVTAGVGNYSANGSDPLAADAGNGSANPNRVMVVQLNSDGEMFSEFRKDNLLTKPKVYQRIQRFGDINMVFEMDMRNITYDDSTTAATVNQNFVEILDPNMAPDINFDVNTESQPGKSLITGGKYIYTDGAGFGGADGTYTYDSGTYDVNATDWEAYFDKYDPTGNPWMFNTNKPQ